MASTSTPLLTLFLASLVSSAVTARPLTLDSTIAPRLNLYNNNNNDDEQLESTNCWGSLLELQSCTGELILFFLNGETYLGPACCGAISAIQHDCLSTLLGSIGFTPEEGDVLRGYCDASAPPTPLAGNSTTTVGNSVVVP
ncbi:hypothetical protein LguiA_013507 [Lonicera macranthoides]